MPPPPENDLTIEEATQKRCPLVMLVTLGDAPPLGILSSLGRAFLRQGLREDSARVRSGLNPEDLVSLTRCVGDDCVWWEWTKGGNPPKGRCGATTKVND